MDSFTDINEPWVNPQDLLNRKRIADFLTPYLASQNKPFVLNLNAEWGFGKTFFIRSWAKSLEDKHPVVYINAWENDFSDDPLLTIMSGITTELQKYFNDTQVAKETINGLLKKCGRLIKSTAPIITKGLVTKAIGDEATDDLGNIIFSNSDSDIVENFASESIRLLLDDHNIKSNNIDNFKTTLGQIIDQITVDEKEVKNQDGPLKPVFILIDELDRCRPSYAIELLENVKHLFSVCGTIFVIATDSSQLQHSISGVYGNKFNGAEYLRRFFDRELTLPAPSYLEIAHLTDIEFTEYNKFVNTAFVPSNINGHQLEKTADANCNQLECWLSFYAQSFNVSIRTFQQCIDQFLAIIQSSNLKWHLPFLLYLLFLYAKHRNIFDQINADVLNRRRDLSYLNNVPPSELTIQWNYNNTSSYKKKQNIVYLTAFNIGNVYIDTIISSRLESQHDFIGNGQKPEDTLNGFVHNSIFEQFHNHFAEELDFIKYFETIKTAGFLD